MPEHAQTEVILETGIVVPRTPEESMQGLYVQEGPGFTVAHLVNRDEASRPRGDPPGTPFALCLPDGTFVAGDVGRSGARLDAVQHIAKEAFQLVAPFDPLKGGDITRVQEALSKGLNGHDAKLSGIMTINNDPRCPKIP